MRMIIAIIIVIAVVYLYREIIILEKRMKYNRVVSNNAIIKLQKQLNLLEIKQGEKSNE